MGFKPISELSTTTRGRAQPCRKRVLDDWSCNVETPSAKLSSGTEFWSQEPAYRDIRQSGDVTDHNISDRQGNLSKVHVG